MRSFSIAGKANRIGGGCGDQCQILGGIATRANEGIDFFAARTLDREEGNNVTPTGNRSISRVPVS